MGGGGCGGSGVDGPSFGGFRTELGPEPYQVAGEWEVHGGGKWGKE